MNPSFNASRFARLMRAHWAENRRNYGWFAAVAAIVDVIVLVLFFAGASSNNRFEAFGFESQVVWFTIGLFLTAPIFAARYFDNLSTSGSALVLLMRPASIFEKWLMSLLWVGLLFPLAFVALYMLLHFPFVSLAQALYVPPDNSGSARYATDLRFYVPFFHYGKQLADVADAKQYFLFEVFIALLVSGLQAFCVACKVYFKKAAALKTVLLAFVILLVVFGVSVVVDWNPTRFSVYWLHSGERGMPFYAWEVALAQGVLVGVPALLWWAVYVNLQEREVN